MLLCFFVAGQGNQGFLFETNSLCAGGAGDVRLCLGLVLSCDVLLRHCLILSGFVLSSLLDEVHTAGLRFWKETRVITHFCTAGCWRGLRVSPLTHMRQSQPKSSFAILLWFWQGVLPAFHGAGWVRGADLGVMNLMGFL